MFEMGEAAAESKIFVAVKVTGCFCIGPHCSAREATVPSALARGASFVQKLDPGYHCVSAELRLL